MPSNGITSRNCPACGCLVLREHKCRVSALIPTTVPPRPVAPGSVSKLHPAGRRKSSPSSTRQPACPDHPSEPRNYCRLCELEAVAPPPNWRQALR